MSFKATPQELDQQFERQSYQTALLGLTIEDIAFQLMERYVQWMSMRMSVQMVHAVRGEFRYFIDHVIRRRGENPSSPYDPQKDEQVQMFERVLSRL